MSFVVLWHCKLYDRCRNGLGLWMPDMTRCGKWCKSIGPRLWLSLSKTCVRGECFWVTFDFTKSSQNPHVKQWTRSIKSKNGLVMLKPELQQHGWWNKNAPLKNTAFGISNITVWNMPSVEYARLKWLNMAKIWKWPQVWIRKSLHEVHPCVN